jgi:hypothetical protein
MHSTLTTEIKAVECQSIREPLLAVLLCGIFFSLKAD